MKSIYRISVASLTAMALIDCGIAQGNPTGPPQRKGMVRQFIQFITLW
jgi:hypothetical protein